MAKTDANTAVFMDSANDGDEDILMKIYEDGKEEYEIIALWLKVSS